jgi:hypothetical protein
LLLSSFTTELLSSVEADDEEELTLLCSVDRTAVAAPVAFFPLLPLHFYKGDLLHLFHGFFL